LYFYHLLVTYLISVGGRAEFVRGGECYTRRAIHAFGVAASVRCTCD
tara:strand:+ start:700 stop:840 length:141 start_codon:yes stop_codon:yes gene_type:complete